CSDTGRPPRSPPRRGAEREPRAQGELGSPPWRARPTGWTAASRPRGLFPGPELTPLAAKAAPGSRGTVSRGLSWYASPLRGVLPVGRGWASLDPRIAGRGGLLVARPNRLCSLADPGTPDQQLRPVFPRGPLRRWERRPEGFPNSRRGVSGKRSAGGSGHSVC